MSKVLISFLGTARQNERQYRTAKYRFSDGQEIESAFIASALNDYYHIDTLILVGTVKSIWEEVYRVFSSEKKEIDDDYYLELAEHCQSANASSELNIPKKEIIENALGNHSKVVLIKYGLDEKEIKQNAETILGLEKHINKGDELYVDITHSFRSLPLFLMNTLIYLQNVSQKNISIKHISYGMLDVTTELGYTPVVELNNIMQMNEWITGAYSFKESGNSYMIASLIEDKSVSEKLIKFSDLMNLNYLSGIETQSVELAGIKNRKYESLLPELIVSPIINQFVNEFGRTKRHSEFQFKLSKWHKNHRNYSSAFIVFLESIITYVCEENGLEWEDMDNRQGIKDVIQGKSTQPLNIPNDLCVIYKEINRMRNSIAHSIERTWNYKTMISVLDKDMITFKKIIKKI